MAEPTKHGQKEIPVVWVDGELIPANQLAENYVVSTDSKHAGIEIKGRRKTQEDRMVIKADVPEFEKLNTYEKRKEAILALSKTRLRS